MMPACLNRSLVLQLHLHHLSNTSIVVKYPNVDVPDLSSA